MFWILFPALIFINVVFVINGIIIFFHPPRTIGSVWGYHTKKAKTNQNTWLFAQREAAKCYIFFGIITTGASVSYIVFESYESYIYI